MSSIISNFRFLSLLVENLFFEDIIKEKLKIQDIAIKLSLI